MSDSVVTNPESLSMSRSFRLRVIAAFFAIYFLWGTTFLAIRIAVEELPPFFAAGVRFLLAGLALYAFMRFKGSPRPTAQQWRNLALIALLMFVAEYGPLFWAEKFVPSGIVSVLAATIPILTLVAEMLILRQQHFRLSVVVSSLIGFVGVGVLLLRGDGQTFGLVPCLAVLAGSVSWSVASVLSRSLDMPKTRPLQAGATMMLGGVGLLIVSASFGEMHPFPHISMRAAGAELYLIVFGSLLAFTAYIWLLAHMPATRVSSYAYVNPIVAVALGHFVANEPITNRTLGGTALVILSVFLILRPAKPAV
ncbi:MAG TPA: EamA family transporter [Terracidiphilus sp.]|jgi:drug/metabolite transporter (DMT)-like permease|nr:EamA family transporter [Terracidiphilus sp.]